MRRVASTSFPVAPALVDASLTQGFSSLARAPLRNQGWRPLLPVVPRAAFHTTSKVSLALAFPYPTPIHTMMWGREDEYGFCRSLEARGRCVVTAGVPGSRGGSSHGGAHGVDGCHHGVP